MKFAEELRIALSLAVEDAAARRHEFLTMEHILRALLNEPKTSELLRACGGDLKKLEVELEAYLQNELESVPAEISSLLKRVLLACEDRQVRELLAARAVVRVDAGPLPVFLDIAQLGRVLELSLGQRRERGDVSTFLRRMPCLSRTVASAAAKKPLAGVRVFLVHHAHILADGFAFVDAF